MLDHLGAYYNLLWKSCKTDKKKKYMIKYLVVGSSGFIGTNLIETLAHLNNIEILGIDIVEPKIKTHLKYWAKVDLLDRGSLLNTIKQFSPDYVIHLGARTDLRGKVLKDYDANMQGVTNLLDVLELIPNLKRVIFASSMYVCKPGYIPKNFEDYVPHTLYGESKVITEKNIKERNPQNYVWSIIRPTSIWGPWFSEPYDKFFRIVLSHSYFHMGSRACKKTYGYIDNTIYQIMTILQTDQNKVNGQVYYLGDYEAYDITEWADEIAKCINIKIYRIPYLLFVLAGWFGDALKTIGVTFPMTSFRLQNMTTDNVHNLKPIQAIAPNLPVTRKEGNVRTIAWITAK